MAIKKKNAKKKRNRARPSEQKTARAQQINLFKRMLRRIVRAVDAEDAYALIPTQEKKLLVLTRFHSLRVEPFEDHDVPRRLIGTMRKLVSTCVKTMKVQLVPDGPFITLDEYFSAGETLQAYISTLADDEYPEAPRIKKGFSNLRNIQTMTDMDPKFMLMVLANLLGLQVSRIDTNLYWFTFTYMNSDSGPLMSAACLQLHRQRAEVLHITLDGKKRPVYHAGLAEAPKGLQWAVIHGRDIGETGVLADVPLPVYIQSHALRRLHERLDCISVPTIHRYLFYSLEKVTSHRLYGKKNLVEYHYNDRKLGYFLVDNTEGVVVIRTFLFITQTGTPEGDRIHEVLRIETIEKEYLEIDKLSTFAHSDVQHNAKLKELFTKCDCGHLFTFEEGEMGRAPRLKRAEDIIKYLGV